MYYTSSGGGKSSGYSGQDGNHEYYSSGAGGSFADPSSRPMSGAGMSYPSNMEYGGQHSQSAYAGGGSAAGSWVDSSLASAQRSLQSWKSVGLSAAGAPSAPLGMERPPSVDPVSLNRMTPAWISGPGGNGFAGGRGVTQNRPRPAAGVQTFQPKGGAHLRGSGAALGPRPGPGPGSGHSMSAPSAFTAGYRSTGHVGDVEFGHGQDPRSVSPSQQPGFGGGMPAPPARGPSIRPAAGVVRPPHRPAQPWHPAPPPPPPPGPTSASSPTPLMDIPRPNTDSRMKTPSPSANAPTPLMEITPFQARLQDFSTKSCSDLGISVQRRLDTKKKRCSLEGFSATAADTGSSQKEEVDRGNDNDDNDDDDSDDDDDDEDADMTQCKLCNIKFEKEQVFF